MDDARQIIIGSDRQPLTDRLFDNVPALFRNAGENASRRFVEFFTANIRNRNTRLAYGQAVRRFCGWCERNKLKLEQLSPPLTAEMLAGMMQVSTRTLWRLLSAGKLIKPVRFGGNVRWRRNEILEWIAAGCPPVEE